MADRDIEDILDSDNELPDSYEEVAELPAYLNDNRFDTIDFPWIANLEHKEHIQNDNDEESSHSSECSEILLQGFTSEEKARLSKKKLIKKGILNQRDIFCIKCVASISSDVTLGWFINFLMLKDMQSDYDYLKSCLVVNFNKDLCTVPADLKTHNFEIVVL